MASRAADKKPVGIATQLTAGGIAGAMEALCCHPLDTIKVRMQLSRSGRAPGTKPRGFIATGAMIVRRETPLALYKGLGAELKKLAHKWQPDREELPSWQHMMIGLVSGAMGPFSNAPIDTIKTPPPGQSAFQRIAHIAREMWREEGFSSFYKGITPRVLRVAPGQAIVFAVYERVRSVMETLQGSSEEGVYSEYLEPSRTAHRAPSAGRGAADEARIDSYCESNASGLSSSRAPTECTPVRLLAYPYLAASAGGTPTRDFAEALRGPCGSNID
ncbi:hypothetical protein BN946_scf184985.g18 [Trametes cinnabarina]|uniref:Mitochondrial carrier n=1 Tax=Pycnoporus cinnabarinus TaxID=5643 RepID=A0A060SK37_PYCCI|nr:hypothetical protein BN946_scf184985.g18 [Trametes cinnabarina]